MEQVREQMRARDARILGLDMENQPAIPDVVIVAKDR
jgi:hypothetical protein